MKIVSGNVRGLECHIKRATVKDFLRTFKANIGLLQETKLRNVSVSTIKQIWGLLSKDN